MSLATPAIYRTKFKNKSYNNAQHLQSSNVHAKVTSLL